jgi:hypothetical protein
MSRRRRGRRARDDLFARVAAPRDGDIFRGHPLAVPRRAGAAFYGVGRRSSSPPACSQEAGMRDFSRDRWGRSAVAPLAGRGTGASICRRKSRGSPRRSSRWSAPVVAEDGPEGDHGRRPPWVPARTIRSSCSFRARASFTARTKSLWTTRSSSPSPGGRPQKRAEFERHDQRSSRRLPVTPTARRASVQREAERRLARALQRHREQRRTGSSMVSAAMKFTDGKVHA